MEAGTSQAAVDYQHGERAYQIDARRCIEGAGNARARTGSRDAKYPDAHIGGAAMPQSRVFFRLACGSLAIFHHPFRHDIIV